MMCEYEYNKSDFMNLEEFMAELWLAKSRNDTDPINIKLIKFTSADKGILYDILLNGVNSYGIQEMKVTIYADTKELERLKTETAYRGKFSSYFVSKDKIIESLEFEISSFSFCHLPWLYPNCKEIQSTIRIAHRSAFKAINED